MDKLKNFIELNYKSEDGAKTSEWSQGNGDDQFSDGFDRGYAVAFKEIADLLEIKVEPLAKQTIE